LIFRRQNSRQIQIGEEQSVLYKRPKRIYNHNPLNYLNNVEYFREIGAENKNTYFVYPTNFSECLSFDKFMWEKMLETDRQTDRQARNDNRSSCVHLTRYITKVTDSYTHKK